MAKNVANVNPLTDTFLDWLTKTNINLDALATIVMTANSTLGNTSGNAHLSGVLAANTLAAIANLMGGAITTNSSSLPEIVPANLNITTNTVFNSNVYIQNVTSIDRANTTHTNTHLYQLTVTFAGNLVSNSTATFTGNANFSGNVNSTNSANFSGNTNIGGNTTLSGNTLVTGLSTFTGNVAISANLLSFGANTRISANGSTGTGYQMLTSNNGVLTWQNPPVTLIIDSIANTSITGAAAANSVKTAYDAAIAANTLAAQAMVAAGSNSQLASQQAYVNAVAYANAISTNAYSNAVAIATTLATAAFTNATSTANILATSAYSNGVTFSQTIAAAAYSNAVSFATTIAATAYSNATSFSVSIGANAYANAVSFATTVAGQAFSNAVSRAANASNLATGTVPRAVLGSGSATAATFLRGDATWAPILTDLGSFTNSPGYINANQRAYPRLIGGGDFNVNWSGQGGQPSWLIGGNDGVNFYVYNPSNFSVAYAQNAGFASSAGSAATAGSVSWNNVAGRPTDLGAFSNGPGYISGGSFAFANGGTGYIIFPNGFKIMWGSVTIPANVAQYAVAYPTAFASYSVPQISGGNLATGTSTNGPMIVPPGGQTTVFYVSNSFNFGTASWWIAVGF